MSKIQICFSRGASADPPTTNIQAAYQGRRAHNLASCMNHIWAIALFGQARFRPARFADYQLGSQNLKRAKKSSCAPAPLPTRRPLGWDIWWLWWLARLAVQAAAQLNHCCAIAQICKWGQAKQEEEEKTGSWAIQFMMPRQESQRSSLHLGGGAAPVEGDKRLLGGGGESLNRFAEVILIILIVCSQVPRQ